MKTPLATISRKVSELESHLHTKLFKRSSRRLMLTDAGSSYVAACKRILADINEAERAASGEYTAATGELIVTAPVGLGRLHLIPMADRQARAALAQVHPQAGDEGETTAEAEGHV